MIKLADNPESIASVIKNGSANAEVFSYACKKLESFEPVQYSKNLVDIVVSNMKRHLSDPKAQRRALRIIYHIFRDLSEAALHDAANVLEKGSIETFGNIMTAHKYDSKLVYYAVKLSNILLNSECAWIDQESSTLYDIAVDTISVKHTDLSDSETKDVTLSCLLILCKTSEVRPILSSAKVVLDVLKTSSLSLISTDGDGDGRIIKIAVTTIGCMIFKNYMATSESYDPKPEDVIKDGVQEVTNAGGITILVNVLQRLHDKRVIFIPGWVDSAIRELLHIIIFFVYSPRQIDEAIEAGAIAAVVSWLKIIQDPVVQAVACKTLKRLQGDQKERRQGDDVEDICDALLANNMTKGNSKKSLVKREKLVKLDKTNKSLQLKEARNSDSDSDSRDSNSDSDGDNEKLSNVLNDLGIMNPDSPDGLWGATGMESKKQKLRMIREIMGNEDASNARKVAIDRLKSLMETLGCCLVQRNKKVSAEQYVDDFENLKEMWVHFYANYMPSYFPHLTDRKEKRVLVIGPGFSVKQRPEQAQVISNAGFQVDYVFPPDPDNLETEKFEAGLQQIVSKLRSFKPHVITSASKGGRYTVALWDKLEKNGGNVEGWNGATVMINPYGNKLPRNVPIAILHGASEEKEFFKKTREELEQMIRTGGHNSAFLYYTAGGGSVGVTQHPSDGHNMVSHLKEDCLPRLIDAVIDRPITTANTNPEYNFIRTWRMFLRSERQASEKFLGFKTDQLVLKFWDKGWDSKTIKPPKLVEIEAKTPERVAVETIFKSEPIERSYHSTILGWPTPGVTNKSTVVSVKRVENLGLENAWRNRSSTLEAVYKSQGMSFESEVHTRWLFHGAPNDETTWKIATNPKSGFAPLATERDVWGKGVNFARDSEYSSGFAARNSRGTKHMFLCLVITGMSCLGSKGRVLHTQHRHGDTTYDSMVDSLSNPEIFVIEDGSCAYPAYVIEYK